MNIKTLSTAVFSLFAASVFCCSTVLAGEPDAGVQILKYDRPANVSTLPDNFRTAQSIFKRAEDGNQPSREGLESLRLSGSSFFAKKEFKEMMRYLPKDDVIILDLRNESHGFVNDNAISWYSRYKTFNKGQNVNEIDRREHVLLDRLIKDGNANIARLGKDKSIKFLVNEKVDSVMTEKEFVESQGIKYHRIPVIDYSAPSNQNIDDFLDFYRTLPKNAWIHAHCEAGVGRTTIFLSMIDMINNADKLSYDEIMTRQVLLGGEDVRQSAAKATDPYKIENYPKRAAFTKYFYDYVKANPDLKLSWTDWVKQQCYEE